MLRILDARHSRTAQERDETVHAPLQLETIVAVDASA
jgi:hypothetical protein